MSSVTGSARGDATSALAKVPRAERRGTTCEGPACMESIHGPPRSVPGDPRAERGDLRRTPTAARARRPARAPTAARTALAPRAPHGLPPRATLPREAASAERRVRRENPVEVPRARVAISALPRLATPSAIWPAAQSAPRPPASFPAGPRIFASAHPQTLRKPRQTAARTASATRPARLVAPIHHPPEPATPAPRHASAPIADHVLIASSSRCRRPPQHVL